jgi:hypothetical protein
LMLSFLPFPALFSLNPKWPFKEDALTEMSQESKWQGSVSSEIFPAFTKAWRHDRNLDFLGWISQKGTLSTLHSSTTKGQVDCLWWAEKQKQEKAATNLSLEVLGLILITAVAFSTSTALIVHVACSHFLPFQMGALMPLFYRGLLATSLHPWIYHISLQITFFFFLQGGSYLSLLSHWVPWCQVLQITLVSIQAEDLLGSVCGQSGAPLHLMRFWMPFSSVLFFLIASCYVAQAGLELWIFLPVPLVLRL